MESPLTMFIVRGIPLGGGDSWILGLYHSEADAQARVCDLALKYEWVWYDPIEFGNTQLQNDSWKRA